METDKNGEDIVFNEKPNPTGEVVGIIKINWEQYCCSINKNPIQKTTSYNTTQNILVVSMDKRIPTIRIRTRQKLLLLTHGVETHLLKDLPSEEKIFRHFVCCIDPPGCKDIDGSLHVRPLSSRNYEVDIADVTYFFKPYTALFRINLCSLRSNVDCLTFSCILELTSKTEVVNVHFTKSVILSKVLLIYEKTQDRNGDGMVQQASKSSVELFTNLYFKDRIVKEEGFIFRIHKNVSKYATLKIFDKKLGVAGISSKLSMKLVESFDPGICVESQNIKIDYKQLNEIDDKIKNRIEIIKKKRRTKPIF
ncbi:hypothetical protein U3516DRAFT_783728 [Neocallimastix sp. 'constans']